MVVKGDGHETAEIIDLLHTAPFQPNNVDRGGLESCILEKHRALIVSWCWSFKGI